MTDLDIIGAFAHNRLHNLLYTRIAFGKASCNTYTAKPRRTAEVRRCRKDTSQQPLESP